MCKLLLSQPTLYRVLQNKTCAAGPACLCSVCWHFFVYLFHSQTKTNGSTCCNAVSKNAQHSTGAAACKTWGKTVKSPVLHSEILQVLQLCENDMVIFFSWLSPGPALVPGASDGAQPGSGLGGERPPRAEQLQQHSSWREAHTAVWEVLSHQSGPAWQPQPHRGRFLQRLLHILLLGEWRQLRHNCQVSSTQHFLSVAVSIHP